MSSGPDKLTHSNYIWHNHLIAQTVSITESEAQFLLWRNVCLCLRWRLVWLRPLRGQWEEPLLQEIVLLLIWGHAGSPFTSRAIDVQNLMRRMKDERETGQQRHFSPVKTWKLNLKIHTSIKLWKRTEYIWYFLTF